jgi:uncharacterized protein YukE
MSLQEITQMKTEKVRQGIVAEFRSVGIYAAAVGFFSAGYLAHMHGSSDGKYLVQLIAWYRTPITLVFVGLPALMILNTIMGHVLELRKNRIQEIETAEKNIAHHLALIDHQKEKLTSNLTATNELTEKLEKKQAEINSLEQRLKAAEVHLRKSADTYSAWAEKVANKVSKTSTTLIGDAGEQAPEQIEQLKQNMKELQRLLDKNPGGINEN